MGEKNSPVISTIKDRDNTNVKIALITLFGKCEYAAMLTLGNNNFQIYLDNSRGEIQGQLINLL